MIYSELNIDDEDIDTMGGWILTENYEAKQGDILNMVPIISKLKKWKNIMSATSKYINQLKLFRK